MDNPNIVVTGANSLLGSNTIRHLLERNYHVTALVRNTEKFVLPAHSNLSLLEGDPMDTNFLDTALPNHDAIVHIAAETRQHLLTYEEYKQVNVDLTNLLIKSAIAHKIKRLILISTATAVGSGSSNAPGNENNAIQYPFSQQYYAYSKWEAEKTVLAYSDQIDVVILNPGFIIGAFDQRPSSGVIITRGIKNTITFVPPGGKYFVNATDVAKAIEAALHQGKNSERYLIFGQYHSYLAFYEKLKAISRHPIKVVTIPRKILLFMGRFGNLLRKLGISTPLSKINMEIVSGVYWYSNEKSIQQLKITYEPIETGISNAWQWYIKSGKLTPKQQ